MRDIPRKDLVVSIQMTDNQNIRIDKFLWAVRLYKTRSQASEACRKGRIIVNDNIARPSKNISVDDIVVVRKPPVTYTYKVLHPLENRISAKFISEFIEDLTPESEKERLIYNKSGFNGLRKKGSGRPTKKERRIIDRWSNGFDDL